MPIISTKLNTPTRVYVVEDEPLIVTNIRISLEEAGYEVVGWSDNAASALREIPQRLVDIVLIDIYLKGREDGIALASALPERLPFIYLTSYSDAPTLQRAKQSFPAGYIVKPFDEADLRANIEIALARHAQARPPSPTPDGDSIFVKQDGALQRVRLSDIEYLQAYDNYTFIHLPQQRLMIRRPLKRLQEQLPPQRFIRCHRTYIINRPKITSITGA
ncbi:MAG: response regulator, partial [Bacteroidota bacterium]